MKYYKLIQEVTLAVNEDDTITPIGSSTSIKDENGVEMNMTDFPPTNAILQVWQGKEQYGKHQNEKYILTAKAD